MQHTETDKNITNSLVSCTELCQSRLACNELGSPKPCPVGYGDLEPFLIFFPLTSELAGRISSCSHGSQEEEEEEEEEEALVKDTPRETDRE
jgi:hypothetical protein